MSDLALLFDPCLFNGVPPVGIDSIRDPFACGLQRAPKASEIETCSMNVVDLVVRYEYTTRQYQIPIQEI